MTVPTVVSVRRTGGIMGNTLSGQLVVPTEPDPGSVEASVADLVDAFDASAVSQGHPYPDMYSYEIRVDGPDGSSAVRVPEHLLDDDLRQLVALVLPPLGT